MAQPFPDFSGATVPPAVPDDIASTFGDFQVVYDETTDDRLETSVPAANQRPAGGSVKGQSIQDLAGPGAGASGAGAAGGVGGDVGYVGGVGGAANTADAGGVGGGANLQGGTGGAASTGAVGGAGGDASLAGGPGGAGNTVRAGGVGGGGSVVGGVGAAATGGGAAGTSGGDGVVAGGTGGAANAADAGGAGGNGVVNGGAGGAGSAGAAGGDGGDVELDGGAGGADGGGGPGTAGSVLMGRNSAGIFFGPIAAEQTTPTETATDADETISAAEIAGKIYHREGAFTAPRTDTLDTAANIVAAFPKAQVGDTFFLFVSNSNTNAQNLIIAAGAGGTDKSAAAARTLAQDASGIFAIRMTNVTPTSEAYDLYRVG